MHLILTDDEFAALEARLHTAGAAASVHDRVALAWHLRERHTRRAQQLAELLLAELLDGPAAPALSSGGTAAGLRLRLQLLQAECLWLFAELDTAQAQARQVVELARQQGEMPLLSDAHLLLAQIAGDRYDLTLRCRELDAAASVAVGCGDDFRLEFAQLCLAHAALRQDGPAASAQWMGHVRELRARPAHPALHMLCNEFLSFEALRHSDFSTVLQVCSDTVSGLTQAGMRRQLALTLTTMGVAFSNLGDERQAMEWMQRSLDIARPTGWPLVLGLALLQVGTVQCRLGQLEASQASLNEGLSLLAPVQGSRIYTIGLLYLAELQRDQRQYEAALATALRLEAPGAIPRSLDLRLSAMVVATECLSELGRADQAWATAQQALELAAATDMALHHAEALRSMAKLHGRHVLPAPPDLREASASLHYLLKALAVFPADTQHNVPPSFYDAIAAEYARLGQGQQAYVYAGKARAAIEEVHRHEVSQRLLSVEAKFQNERIKAEGEHLRQLAEASAERAELLSQTGATLEKLGLIGQEITAHLQEQAVYATLDRNVHGLLSAQHFAIYLLDAEAAELRLAYGTENGQPIAPFAIALDASGSQAARCARERCEIFRDIDPTQLQSLLPGTAPTLSSMFMPLLANERVLGVMSIQSTQAHAYADRERLIFRSLAAYSSIALENTSNYRRLEATLGHLHQAQAEVLEKNQELERAYQSLQDISLTDPLTGLRNRRFLEQHLAAEVAQCLRLYQDWRRQPERPRPTESDLVFLLVDIDHFKCVNDDWGHPAGDAVLVQMRERLRRACRESDYLVRWGGEEFLVVARAVDAASGPLFAERIRAAVAEQPFVIDAGGSLALSCSVGFAALPFIAEQPERLDWQQVVSLADQALYMAKRAGRNTWVGLSASAECGTLADLSELLSAPQFCVKRGWLRLSQPTLISKH
ncbi:sensor domain-containing diguanylate cyclase [Paucibacter sp. DJ2R-2]|uniref:GGDEF domain-containing protein n=1 Tax=Paucibacter sp. DJ2R-2 TaxID=2893558 RepID=UPI0021E39432|nr:GGDEF domain-containing protein [Paucibacter sp. DJ2R-2]MCV2421392.1 sensor domain-containing diguanylate cyclase [Paucibacter sp. DJ4R-1]MCV2441153.1 sensor domain-containing diguanylate cyclase [Paucibacter sp. DJ2R-2]